MSRPWSSPIGRGPAGGWGDARPPACSSAWPLNCKPPFGTFLLPVAAAADVPSAALRMRAGPGGRQSSAGVGVGVAAYVGYDGYTYPGDVKATHAELLQDVQPGVRRRGVAAAQVALVELAAGPGSGMVWYAPAALLGALGAARRAAGGRAGGPCGRPPRRLPVAVGFVVCLSFYKGDPAWGPRYLTPLFAVGWLYAPDGVLAVGRRLAAGLLVVGCAVQVLGLAVDPQRLYYDRGMPPGFSIEYPMLHFEWELSHLLNRPREIVETWTAPPLAPELQSDGRTDHRAGIVLLTDTDPDRRSAQRREMVRRYQVYNGPRVW